MRVDRSLAADVRASLVATGADPSTRSVADALRRERRVLDHDGVSRLVQEMRSDSPASARSIPWSSPLVLQTLWSMATEKCSSTKVAGWSRSMSRFVTTSRSEARATARNISCRRIDDANPYVDAPPLPGRVRLHAVFPPISDRICVSLRIARRTAFTTGRARRCANNRSQLTPFWSSSSASG